MAVGAAGCAQPATTPPADPSGAGVIGTGDVAEGGLPVDVVVGDQLLAAGGGEISLADVVACELCGVAGAWRVPDGWLVSVSQTHEEPPGNTVTLWRIPESGAPIEVMAADGLVLVGKGTAELPGILVAWVADERLHVGRYADGALDEVASTPAPVVEVEPVGDLGDTRPLWPHAFVGAGVVLAGTLTGGGLDFWDVWFPERGDFVPAEYPAISMHGITPDGDRIIADYLRYPGTASKETCLGELELDGFTPAQSICPSPVGYSARIDPSPDGQWWLVQDVDGVSLYEAGQLWSGGERTVFRPGAGGWIDATSFAVVDESGVVTVHVDGPVDELVPLPPADRAPLLVMDLSEGV
jgi:hypothetical protein